MCQALFKKITANMFSGGGSRINWEEHRGRLQTQREGRQWHPNYKVYIYCGVGYNYTVLWDFSARAINCTSMQRLTTRWQCTPNKELTADTGLQALGVYVVISNTFTKIPNSMSISFKNPLEA